MSSAARKLWKEQRVLQVVNGQLVRHRKCSGEDQSQLILPRNYRIREWYFWLGMHQTVGDYIASFGRCLRRKDWNLQRAQLVNTKTHQPMELVCMDFLKLEPSKGGIENILVVTDHFTKYAQTYPTQNQSAKTTVKVLFENFFHSLWISPETA